MDTLLLCGLHLPGSGLTNVMAGLGQALARHFQVSLLGFEPGHGESGEARLAGRPIRILGCPPHVFAAPRSWLAPALSASPPDAVLVSGPGFMAAPFLQQLQPLRGRTRLALYLPVEGELSGDTLGGTVGLVDDCLLYSRDALRGVEGLCARMAVKHRAFLEPRLAAVGHGFDRRRFHPIGGGRGAKAERARRRSARAALFPGRSDLADAFIVLNANRIAHRKRLDLTIEGFARFARGKSDVRLCLHIGRRSPDQECALRAQAAGAGLADMILISPDSPDEILPEARLNLLYNACDAGLSTSSGEGWGLGIFEHAASRAAQVVPDHTSFRENWTGAATLVPTSGSEFIFYESATMHAPDPTAIAAALEKLHSDPRFRAEAAKSARRRALSSGFTWHATAGRIAAALRAAPAPGYETLAATGR